MIYIYFYVYMFLYISNNEKTKDANPLLYEQA